MSKTLSFVALSVALALTGCSHDVDDGTKPTSSAEELPSLKIREDTPGMLLTWIDDKGETHTEVALKDVPPAGRDRVRVVLSDRQEGTRGLFYVVDLNHASSDGSFEATTMPRAEWEALIAKRRDAQRPPPPPEGPPGRPFIPDGPPPTADPGAPPKGPVSTLVVIYGAEWCGPCHQAQAYLKKKGVSFTMKDVDRDPGAEAEMRAKLARAGRHGGSIPVIDVGGQILVGFSGPALDAALAKAKSVTVL